MFIETILSRYPTEKKIIVFTRDELEQSELKGKYPGKEFSQMHCFIEHVRDRDRLLIACEGVDIIIHAAAIKQVDNAEYNPSECLWINVDGADNVIRADLDCGVSTVVVLSADKACAPINLCEATKPLSDKLFTAVNNIKGSKSIKFSVVRYGNVMGSRGSVIPFFIEKKSDGVIPIKHPKMTRFNISLRAGVDMVLYALEYHLEGEIFVPTIPSSRNMYVA